ncbi:hypothetical protein COCMIDRAFT_87292 [Bipolaris oryzae ATCC 44560]|uniref:Carboxylic ester hydrolase n=1 Tax=Bipolaris oryzae ATCC 44560 TaxID=930090 RepID=W6ZF08_COCMI|nr:uncharacterized protein COCMIDRAFT_87292 [Bipolaris oryzae ATCC 44560]EUC48463.1 hypothetical protein COCMIDRAFT_87292 [Bipolaris oryzae ATCC 44560]
MSCSTPFGSFKGWREDGVVQYRGIKYAFLRNQMAAPELVTGYGSEMVDATEFGPRAPAMDGCAFEQSTLIQCDIGGGPDLPMSGTECLNLNVTVPADTLVSGGLPVMVFIHGGGFIMGGSHWPQYDPCQLVKMSVEMKMPIVAVNINFRLGILGNLTSEELRRAGYPGNNSLRDQQCALRWVKKFIGGFGGDKDNVTVLGESAGAVSVLHQLSAREPLFKRAISMSGTPLMLKPMSASAAEASYDSITKALGLEGTSTQERINRLLNISSEELVEKTPMTVPLIPFQDNNILPQTPTFTDLRNNNLSPLNDTFCEELLIGSCAHDGNVFFFMGLSSLFPNIASALTSSFSRSLSAPAAQIVLSTYGVNPSTPDEEAKDYIIDLATDIAYHAPAQHYARAFKGRTWTYRFNQGNPWDGMFKGKSTHLLDAAFLFQNFNDYMDDEAKETARRFAEDFVVFASGKANATWDDGLERCYGEGGCKENKLEKLIREQKVDLDELSGAWDIFLAGK